MALNPSTNTTMTGRVTAATSAYPYASSKDESSPGAGDGTPYFKARADDIFGLQQALLKAAAIVPSGNADEVGDSQYLQSIVALASGLASFYTDSGAADAYVLDVRTDSQGPASYEVGLAVEFDAANTGTGAATANVAGLGVKNIKRLDGRDPEAGDIQGRMRLVYDGTNFVIIPQLDARMIALLQNGPKNGVLNGNFQFWQEATSQTSSGYGSDDCSVNEHSGSSKTHSQQSFALGQTDVGGDPEFFSRTAVTSSAGAGNYVAKRFRLENVAKWSGKTVVLIFDAKADSAKDIATEFVQNFGTGGSPSSSVNSIGVTTHTLASTWGHFAVVAEIPSVSTKTLGTNGDDYFEIVFWFDAGSSFDSRTNTLGQQSGTFDLAMVDCKAGSYDTGYEQLDKGAQLALIQPFIQKSYPLTVDPGSVNSDGRQAYAASGTSTKQKDTTFQTPMRSAAPTVTLYSPTSGASGNIRDVTGAADVAASASEISQFGFSVAKSTNHTDQNAYAYQFLATDYL